MPVVEDDDQKVLFGPPAVTPGLHLETYAPCPEFSIRVLRKITVEVELLEITVKPL